MNTKIFYSLAILCCLILISWMVPFQKEKDPHRPERIKITLREVGNQLLMSIEDSTSIILPVVQISEYHYKLSFQKDLTFLPDSLVSILDRNFEKAGLSKNYIIEVLRCEDLEVSYSYEKSMYWDKTIVPCSGREVPEACHTIEVQFIKEAKALSKLKIGITAVVMILMGFVVIRFRESTNSKDLLPHNTSNTHLLLGSFYFYPDQHKLVKETLELPLSRKECELLTIFVARANKVVKREELIKTVWEDQGVIVGRSLDTYISKLRKKLKEDSSLKIVNIHGIGYRLETR